MIFFYTKINYLVILGRALFSIFFLLLSLTIILNFPDFIEVENSNFGFIIGTILFLFVVLFLFYRFGKSFLHESNVLIFENNGVTKKNLILRKSVILRFTEIKGFSTSNYPTKIWNYKSIIIYLRSGEKIEIPQFLYFNFKDISFELEKAGIKRFGHEKFRWKFFDSRYYDFE